ncbi:MAG: outer membrane protein assembly factor BamC [Sterolibacterium sp.]|nr:outer membrane protein assembly factor BamC [Sterolibacterium sp.]MBP9800301.1 outer membrane protein assembly factor BamC [Sterolibacterium sp.]
MKHRLLLPTLLTSLLVLAGCGGTLLESKKVDYKSAGRLPSLEVPPDLTAPTNDARYSIPENSRGSVAFSSYQEGRQGQEASGSAALAQAQADNKVRLERDGTQRWLVVSGSQAALWPVVRTFWQDMGFTLTVDQPDAGVMETDWSENRAKLPHDIIRSTIGKTLDFLYSMPERDKFRTRFEKGSAPGAVDIYVSHRGMMEVYINEGRSETRWQPRPLDPELEAEMLQRLMVRLGVDAAKAKEQLTARPNQKVEDRARLTPAGGGLIVQEPFDRAWRRIGLALDRAGFTVEDRDRKRGLYFVRYVDPDSTQDKGKADKGLLAKLMFWKSDKDEAGKAPQMRVQVKDEKDISRLLVQNREGQPENSDTARRILKLLYEQLK